MTMFRGYCVTVNIWFFVFKQNKIKRFTEQESEYRNEINKYYTKMF